jgi:hypothetical protein
MLPPRTALGFTIALLALPATAAAKPADLTAGGETGPSHMVRSPYRDYYGAAGLLHMRTSSLAGTTSPQLSPDAADAARAGDIAKAIEHYERSQPVPTTAKPASHDNNAPAWPEIAFAGVVLLATTAGVVRVRMRRSQRVAA